MWLAEIVDPSSPITWAQLGVLGLGFWAILRGLLWAKPAVDDLKSGMAELKKENKELNTFLREAVVPALTTSSTLGKESTQTVREATELMRLLAEELKRRGLGET